MNDTRFKELLNYLGDSISEEEKNEAILTYFGKEDESEYTIADTFYYVFDEDEVKDIIRDTAKHDCEAFINSINYAKSSFNNPIMAAYIAEYIDIEDIIASIVYEFSYDTLEDYDLLDTTKNFYIYQDTGY